jgi:hypothetical protein
VQKSISAIFDFKLYNSLEVLHHVYHSHSCHVAVCNIFLIVTAEMLKKVQTLNSILLRNITKKSLIVEYSKYTLEEYKVLKPLLKTSVEHPYYSEKTDIH